MNDLMTFYINLTFLEKIGLLGSFASIISLSPLLISFFRNIYLNAPNKVLQEFWFVYNHPPHFLLTGIAVFSIGTYLSMAEVSALHRILVILAFLSMLFLLMAFFVRQNRPIMRQLILSHIENTVKNHDGVVSAIKFDVDLIVAINDYSHAVGNAIVATVKDALSKKEKELKSIGTEVVSIEIPESDEVLWILPLTPVNRAGDIADEIRRTVKLKIKDIPYYREACDFVTKKLTSPPLTDEEKEGIGTVSAGVAAYDRGVESLLADISSAVKESKFRGRNRTIIYQREQLSIIREH